MFLTRMALDINRPDTAHLLEHPEEIRAMVASAFEHGSSQVLWRIDELSNRIWIVMLSRLRPDLWNAHEQYGYLGAFPSWDTMDFDRELDEAYDGTRWRFEVCAAPVGVQTARVEAWQADDYLNDWLRRQGDSCGFLVQESRVESFRWVPLEGRYLLVARWTGRLTVTEEGLFQWALCRGVGGCRDLGAGLMTIARSGSVWQ